MRHNSFLLVENKTFSVDRQIDDARFHLAKEHLVLSANDLVFQVPDHGFCGEDLLKLKVVNYVEKDGPRSAKSGVQ